MLIYQNKLIFKSNLKISLNFNTEGIAYFKVMLLGLIKNLEPISVKIFRLDY